MPYCNPCGYADELGEPRAFMRFAGGIVPDGAAASEVSLEKPLYLGAHPSVVNRLRHVRTSASGRQPTLPAPPAGALGGP